MQVTIELTPQQGEHLQQTAQAEGLDLATLVQRLVTEHVPTTPASPPDSSSSTISEKNKAAIAMLQSWIAEGLTADPEEVRQAEAEVEELKRNLNANRAATGERPVFR
jgi:hypothetical protein